MGQREKEQARRRKGRVSPIGSYTGFPPVNTQQFIQPRQSGNNALDARGFVKTDISDIDEQARQREPSFVDQLNAGVKTYEGINKAYKGGQNAAKWFEKTDFGQYVPDGVRDLFSGGSEPAGLLNSPDPSTVVNPGATAAPFNPDVGGPSAGDANMYLWGDNTPQGAYNHGAVAGVQGQSTVNPNANSLFADTPVLNDSVGSGAGTGYGGLTSTAAPTGGGGAGVGAAAQNNALGKASNLQVGDQAFSNFLSGGKTALSGLLGQGGGDALAGTYSAASGGTQLANASATTAGNAAIASTGMAANVGGKAAEEATKKAAEEAAKSAGGSAMGNAAPFVSGAFQAYQAHEAFKRGDYVNGTIDTIQVGLGFIPGVNLVNIPIDILQFAFS